MFIITKEKKALSKENTLVPFTSWKDIQVFTHYVTASQKSMKIGGGFEVIPVKEFLGRVLIALAPLGDGYIDKLFSGDVTATELVKAGGAIEKAVGIVQERRELAKLRKEIEDKDARILELELRLENVAESLK